MQWMMDKHNEQPNHQLIDNTPMRHDSSAVMIIIKVEAWTKDIMDASSKGHNERHSQQLFRFIDDRYLDHLSIRVINIYNGK